MVVADDAVGQRPGEDAGAGGRGRSSVGCADRDCVAGEACVVDRAGPLAAPESPSASPVEPAAAE